MKKEEFELEKKLEKYKHECKLEESSIRHANRMEEIRSEKEARITVDAMFHENKKSLHRLKRADDRRKQSGEWGPNP